MVCGYKCGAIRIVVYIWLKVWCHKKCSVYLKVWCHKNMWCHKESVSYGSRLHWQLWLWVVESLECRGGGRGWLVIDCSRHFSIKSRILKNQKVRVETGEHSSRRMIVFVVVETFPNPPPIKCRFNLKLRTRYSTESEFECGAGSNSIRCCWMENTNTQAVLIPAYSFSSVP